MAGRESGILAPAGPQESMAGREIEILAPAGPQESMTERRIEILAPAGSPESLRAAVCAGADAVYIGGTRFGARAYAKNLSESELLDAIDYVHIHGRRLYLTVNTLLKDSEIDQLYEYLLPYYLRGIDGVIVQDIGVILYLRKYFPELPVHASTQMTITGADGASLLKEMGVTRVVPARELSLSEIRQMKEETGLEIECFVHGALCYCYSGQCLLSSMIGGRSGNRGQCAQPCRLPYRAGGKKAEDLMSLKDLCTVDLIPDLMEAGIDSFKIEGRMKQPEYVYTVTSIYRKYTALYLKEGKENYKVSEADRDILLGAYQRRGYTEGYYKQHNGKDMISMKRPSVREGGNGQGEESLDSVPDHAASQDKYKIKEKINGNLILSPGKHAKLILSWCTHRAECEGETVKPALRQPLETERVEKQMRKTGNTEFEFDELKVLVDKEVFLPMQALNELRRNGIRELMECILQRYRRRETNAEDKLCEEVTREAAASSDQGEPEALTAISKKRDLADSHSKQLLLSCLVQSKEQLEAVVCCGQIGAVYIDSILGEDRDIDAMAAEKRQKGCKVFLAMPYIFRAKEAERMEGFYGSIEDVYDGVLVRNLESYQWLKRHGYAKEIHADHNLYVFNRYGKTFMESLGVRNYTAPVELNARELRRLGIRGACLSVYGYQPVMISANCIAKTTGKCVKEEGYLYIRDRYQKEFAVRRCCRYCYNIIYNSAPLFLADRAEAVLELAPGEIRLDFTTETGREAGRIAELYTDAFIWGKEVAPPKTEYTRGHMKRGVK